jgi:asparagine synthase (glutamine-hydrolysing)
MCGITGIIGNGSIVDIGELKKMNDVLEHRGPDGSGLWHEHDFSIGFAHRRLAIIDLNSNANQPMHFDNLVITFNGEIYNYLELRTLLISEGYQFATNSDTEVILAMYKKYGIDCIKYLDGMFAFGIYDKSTKITYLVRDRFGEKPLYYAKKLNSIYFASEIKSLLSIGITEKPKIEKYKRFILGHQINHIEDIGSTYFDEIFECKPAHYLMHRDGEGLITQQYWSLQKKDVGLISEEDAILYFKELMINSVKQRMVSDVELGSSLSGGLDSSTIVSIMDNLTVNKRTQKQKTFSARFDNFSKDEGVFIGKLLETRKTILGHDVFPTMDSFIHDFDKLIYHQEEPFGSASIYNQYTVMRLAKQNNVKVLLDGQGADEILGGYIEYYFHYLTRLAIIQPFDFLKEVRLYNGIHFNHRPYSLPKRLPLWILDKLITGRSTIYHRDVRDRMYEETCYTNLPSMLRYADKNSMANSVEVRLPFLDHKIVEFLYNLPTEYLLNNGWTKSILRKSFQNDLPNEICWRVDKIGYEAPQDKWLEGFQYKIDGFRIDDIIGSVGLNPKKIVLTNWKKLMLGSYYK